MAEVQEQETAGAVLARLGTDGAKWAAEFVAAWQRFAFSGQGRGILADPSPGGFLHGWFCNAIEAGRSAPRDGLAGSDEAIEAALSTVDWNLVGEPNGTTMASAREAAVHVAVTVAARVRAEAVAGERQRIAELVTAALVPDDVDEWSDNNEGWNRALGGTVSDGDGQ